jgi:hypothetical protein
VRSRATQCKGRFQCAAASLWHGPWPTSLPRFPQLGAALMATATATVTTPSQPLDNRETRKYSINEYSDNL